MDDPQGGIAPFQYGFDLAVGLQSRIPDAVSNLHKKSLSSVN